MKLLIILAKIVLGLLLIIPLIVWLAIYRFPYRIGDSFCRRCREIWIESDGIR